MSAETASFDLSVTDLPWIYEECTGQYSLTYRGAHILVRPYRFGYQARITLEGWEIKSINTYSTTMEARAAAIAWVDDYYF